MLPSTLKSTVRAAGSYAVIGHWILRNPQCRLEDPNGMAEQVSDVSDQNASAGILSQSENQYASVS